MNLWHKGDILLLLDETILLQSKLPVSTTSKMAVDKLARLYQNLIIQGRVSAANKLLKEECKKGNHILIDEHSTVLLQKLHPTAESPGASALIFGERKVANPIIYDAITAEVIHSCFLHSNGSAGVSGRDSDHWKDISSNYSTSSQQLELYLLDLYVLSSTIQ
jgi:hypothetical protein